jgi:hypothetical protein
MMKISITLLALAAMSLPAHAQDSTPFAGGSPAFIRD